MVSKESQPASRTRRNLTPSKHSASPIVPLSFLPVEMSGDQLEEALQATVEAVEIERYRVNVNVAVIGPYLSAGPSRQGPLDKGIQIGGFPPDSAGQFRVELNHASQFDAVSLDGPLQRLTDRLNLDEIYCSV